MEQIVRLDGVAGAGKATTLAVVREAEAYDYNVEGFAPTSRAAQKLAEAGIETEKLQAHLAGGERVDTGEHRLYVVGRNGVRLDFIRPGTPVENGYIESFNGRLRDECLKVEVFFNHQRPHLAFGRAHTGGLCSSLPRRKRPAGQPLRKTLRVSHFPSAGRLLRHPPCLRH